MTLKLAKGVYEELVAYAIEGGANEICGYLSGNGEIASKLHRLKNISDTPETFFWMDPKEQFSLQKSVRDIDHKLMVCFHSHPTGGEDLSSDDKKILRDKNINYIIVSLRPEVPSVKAWSFDGNEYSELQIIKE